MVIASSFIFALILTTAGVANAITNANDDVSNPTTDAVVLFGNGCSGVLISPTLVLGSGHCTPGQGDYGGGNPFWSTENPVFRSFSLPEMTPYDGLDSAYRADGATAPEDVEIMYDQDIHGRDYYSERMPSDSDVTDCLDLCLADDLCKAFTFARPDVFAHEGICFLKRHRMEVHFGNTKDSPQWSTYTSSWSMAGYDDFSILRLEEAVPQEIATPVRHVLTQLGPFDDNWLYDLDLKFSGFGGDHAIRQVADALAESFPCCGQTNMMQALGVDGETLEGGDSGSPLLAMIGDKLFVLGEAQGPSGAGGGRFIATFATGDGDPEKPDISQYMNNLLYMEDYPDAQGLIPMHTWYNEDRKDHMSSSDPRWNSVPESHVYYGSNRNPIHNQRVKDGYREFNFNGYIFSPHEEQPDDTIPLFSWWSDHYSDHFATTDPGWSMEVDDIVWNSDSGEHIANGPSHYAYTLYRLEGFIYDPTQPQPSCTVPLFSWYSSTRAEFHTTTADTWQVPLSNIVISADGGQRFIDVDPVDDGYVPMRLEGFVPTKCE